jgi:ubiquinone biosynthesis protein UbiJ
MVVNENIEGLKNQINVLKKDVDDLKSRVEILEKKDSSALCTSSQSVSFK